MNFKSNVRLEPVRVSKTELEHPVCLHLTCLCKCLLVTNLHLWDEDMLKHDR